MGNRSVEAQIRGVFAAAGVTGWLHATDIDGPGREVGVDADAPVVLGSVVKVPLVVAFFRAADAGRLDPTTLVTVPAHARGEGATGIAAMLDPVTMSLRDLAYLALTVSDNVAADALAEHVGLDEVHDTLATLGLEHTRVTLLSRDIATRTSEDLGTSDRVLVGAMLADPAVVRRLRVLDPATSNSSTPRDCTRLVRAIWRDEAASATSCAAIRRLLGLQVWPHRLAAAFPTDAVRVAAGKSGTLPTVRNEIGALEFADGRRFAVAVFTRSASPASTLPESDASITEATRLAVEALS
jgi:beta-lactamase class A